MDPNICGKIIQIYKEMMNSGWGMKEGTCNWEYHKVNWSLSIFLEKSIKIRGIYMKMLISDKAKTR